MNGEAFSTEIIMRQAFSPRTAVAERSPLPCRSPYELLTPVRALRKDLGLTPNDLAVLSALISFLPRADQDKAKADGHPLTIVFPSNAALADRANGLDERTLRRCIARLTGCGLITRRDSANGKRFPLRYNGRIRDAFGFDLQPLIDIYPSLTDRARQATEERERLRSLKAEALALRAAVLQQPDLGQDDLSKLDAIRTLLRRATLTVDSVLALIRDLRCFNVEAAVGHGESEAADVPTLPAEQTPQDEPVESGCLSGTDGQPVRHIESNNIDKKIERRGERLELPSAQNAKGRNPEEMEWNEFHHVSGFFPEAPRNVQALKALLFDLGGLLRIGESKVRSCLMRSGPGRLLLAFDQMIPRAGQIKDPGAYLEKMLTA